jgi:hypothetical protein
LLLSPDIVACTAKPGPKQHINVNSKMCRGLTVQNALVLFNALLLRARGVIKVLFLADPEYMVLLFVKEGCVWRTKARQQS